MEGDTYHGISVDGRGIFSKKGDRGMTYAGQHRDGYACGLGVLTWSDGSKEYAEYGPDGHRGRCLYRSARGINHYSLYERGEWKVWAGVFADGSWQYNGRGISANHENCEPDDPRVLALIAQVAPVEVRPAAPAPTRNRPPLAPRQCPMRRLVLPPQLQALADAVATEVKSHAARRRWWPRGTTHSRDSTHDRVVTRPLAGSI